MKRYEKYKSSGIPRVGEIPEHWKVRRLKFLGNIKYGLGTPPKPKPDGLRLIRATDVQRGRIVEAEKVFVDPEDVRYDRDPVLKGTTLLL